MILNIGIRAHDMGNLPLHDLVNEVSNKGLTSVQLALSKSFKELNSELGSLNPGFARFIGRAFQNKDIQIAVLGCYINMIHPDQNERKKALDRFKEHIRFARDFGCSIVGTETGNVHAEIAYTEENFKEEPFLEVVKSVSELVEEAEKFGVIVGIEGGINHPVYSPIMMKRLLDSVSSNNLQVIFDPVNYLTMENYKNQEVVIQEAFELFGDRIVILHAKDFVIEHNEIKITSPGDGMLNYDVVLKFIKENKPFLNILIEEIKVSDINRSISFLTEKYIEV